MRTTRPPSRLGIDAVLDVDACRSRPRSAGRGAARAARRSADGRWRRAATTTPRLCGDQGGEGGDDVRAARRGGGCWRRRRRNPAPACRSPAARARRRRRRAPGSRRSAGWTSRRRKSALSSMSRPSASISETVWSSAWVSSACAYSAVAYRSATPPPEVVVPEATLRSCPIGLAGGDRRRGSSMGFRRGQRAEHGIRKDVSDLCLTYVRDNDFVTAEHPMPTVVQTTSIASRPTSWADEVTLDRVDPLLDDQSISLSLTGTVVSTVATTNNDLSPSALSSTDTAEVTLERPDGSGWITTSPSPPSAPSCSRSRRPCSRRRARIPPRWSITPGNDRFIGCVAAGGDRAGHVAGHRIGADSRDRAGQSRASFASFAAATVTEQADTAPFDEQVSGSGTIADITPFAFGYAGTVTTAAQLLTVADATTGASSALALNGFNPALGWLSSVNITLMTDAAGTTEAEKSRPDRQFHHGEPGSLGRAESLGWNRVGRVDASLATTKSLDAFDGSADFAGPSGTQSAQQTDRSELQRNNGIDFRG